MFILLSPAKTLDMTRRQDQEFSKPRLLNDTQQLMEILKNMSRADLQDLMSISEKLADLNFQRNQDFSLPFNEKNATPAIFAFQGDVYLDLDAKSFSQKELERANNQIRILSGLYGVLRPLDLMQAYRLEMGTRLKNDRGNNLYEFWGDRITQLLQKDIDAQNATTVLNLASQEYAKSIDLDNIQARVLTPHFKEKRKGKLRVIAFNAKKARGRMSHLIIKENIQQPKQLQELVVNDYIFNEDLSTENDWVWTK